LKQYGKDWPAIEKWTDNEYFIKSWGKGFVGVHVVPGDKINGTFFN